MANNSTLEMLKSIERQYRKAEINAHVFVAIEKGYKMLLDKKMALLEKIGDVSLFWKNCWWLAVIGVICLGIFQGFSAQTVIQAILDPNAEGSIPTWVCSLVGASVSIIGMILGHFLYDSVRVDNYTDEKNFGAMFYLMLALSIFYIAFQFGLAYYGGQDALTEGETNSMPYIVAGLGLFEIIIGAFILEKALLYVALMFENIILGIKQRKMRRKSRATNDNFRDYSTLIDAYNTNPNVEPKQREGNDNIRKAIAFYAGIQLPPDEQILPPTPIEPINAINVQSARQREVEQPTVQQSVGDEQQEISINNSQSNSLQNNVQTATVNNNQQANTQQTKLTREVTAKEAEEELEAFLEDTVDADLTV